MRKMRVAEPTLSRVRKDTASCRVARNYRRNAKRRAEPPLPGISCVQSGMTPPISRVRFAASALVLAAATIPLATVDPATTWWFPSCPLYMLTGLLCPLCGSLRALHALLTGAPLAALAFNPLLVVGLVAWVLARRQAAAFSFSARGVALAIVFGVLRNIPSTWLVH